MFNDDPINILIPDGESVLANYIVSCLSALKHIKIHILSSNDRAPIKYSRFISSFVYKQRDEHIKERVNFIKSHVKLKEITVVLPVEIQDLRILSEYFEELNVNSLIPPLNSIDETLDKWIFFKFINKHALPTPVTFNSMASFVKADNHIDFPVLLKPKIGRGGFGISKILDLKSLEAEFEQNNEFLAQEFIKGYDIDMSVLCKNGKILAYTMQKGIVFGPAKYSAALCVKFLYHDSIYNDVKVMMEKLQWSGFAHIDLRYDSKVGNFKILEINPRAWGTIEASNSVGVNFPYLYILAALDIPFDIPNYSFDTCASNMGLIQILKAKFIDRKKDFSFPRHKYQLKHFYDPLPLIKTYLNSIKS